MDEEAGDEKGKGKVKVKAGEKKGKEAGKHYFGKRSAGEQLGDKRSRYSKLDSCSVLQKLTCFSWTCTLHVTINVAAGDTKVLPANLQVNV